MKKVFLGIICSLLTLLFVYTVASKIIDINRYVDEMNNQPFPGWLSSIFIWMIPFLEIAIAILLFFDRTRKFALYASLILMSAFSIYTALVLFHFFARVPCSCGGVIRNLSWGQHLLFNLFFVALCIIGIRLEYKIKKDTGENKPTFAI